MSTPANEPNDGRRSDRCSCGRPMCRVGWVPRSVRLRMCPVCDAPSPVLAGVPVHVGPPSWLIRAVTPE